MLIDAQDPGFREALALAPPTVVVASFRRSGTHLTIDSLLNNAARVHPNYLTLETLNPTHRKHVSGETFVARLAEAGHKSVIVKTHFGPRVADDNAAWWEQAKVLIERSRTVYVVRDPRDVMLSLQRFICSHSPKYQEKTFSEHLDQHLPLWRDHVAFWNAREVPIVRFEDWAQSYDATLLRCLGELGLGRNNGTIVRLYQYKHRRKRAKSWRSLPLIGRMLPPLEGSVTTTARMLGSGSVGAWRGAYSSADRQKVVDICGPWLERLGYAP